MAKLLMWSILEDDTAIRPPTGTHSHSRRAPWRQKLTGGCEQIHSTDPPHRPSSVRKCIRPPLLRSGRTLRPRRSASTSRLRRPDTRFVKYVFRSNFSHKIRSAKIFHLCFTFIRWAHWVCVSFEHRMNVKYIKKWHWVWRKKNTM